MKKYIIKFIEKYLFELAKKRLLDKKTCVIAVTGSAGKTSTKEAIRLLLEEFYPGKVFASHGNMNESIGIPMAVLGFDYLPTKAGWPKVLFQARKKAKNNKFPEYLILEMGVEKPGDINYFTKLVKPNIAVITNIGHAHLEGLGDIAGVLKEKTVLFNALPEDGVAIYNFDDKRLQGYATKIRAKKISFGLSSGSDISAKIIHLDAQGTLLEVTSNGLKKQIRSQLIGSHSIYSLLSAMAVSKSLDLNFDRSLLALKKLSPIPGRMNLIAGVKDSLIIDDTYNANPNSVVAALATLKSIESSGRKVVVLGNMNELGKFEEKAHLMVAGTAALTGDLLVFIGQNATLMKEEAERIAKNNSLTKVKIMTFETPSQANISFEGLIEKGDLILVKASQNRMRLERLVETIMANPKEAKDKLVRQDNRWRK